MNIWLKCLVAAPKDTEFTFEIRNANRVYFINSEKISKEDHIKWVKTVVKDRLFYIIMDEYTRVGTCSFYNNGGIGVIGNFVISKLHRDKGYAGAALKCLEEKARGLGIYKLTLEVLSDNDVAINFYKTKGFKFTKTIVGQKELR